MQQRHCSEVWMHKDPVDIYLSDVQKSCGEYSLTEEAAIPSRDEQQTGAATTVPLLIKRHNSLAPCWPHKKSDVLTVNCSDLCCQFLPVFPSSNWQLWTSQKILQRLWSYSSTSHVQAIFRPTYYRWVQGSHRFSLNEGASFHATDECGARGDWMG